MSGTCQVPGGVSEVVELLFGAHVSVSKGYPAALDYAREVGCDCIQIFAKSPRQWNASPLSVESCAEFLRLRTESGFGPVFTHTAYLINLATDDPVMRSKSIAALADELERGALLGASGVVTHLGTARDGDRDAAARRIASAIAEAYDQAAIGDSVVRLLLENTAGAGTTYGSDVKELARVIDLGGFDANMVGICIDTCHAFAAGIPLSTEEGWNGLIAAIASGMGADRLGLIHANDCAFALGSHKDRHSWIGDGGIGDTGFSAMVRHPALRGMSVVTEMPGEVPEKDVANLQRLHILQS